MLIWDSKPTTRVRVCSSMVLTLRSARPLVCDSTGWVNSGTATVVHGAERKLGVSADVGEIWLSVGGVR